jgi:hypothetical protein
MFASYRESVRDIRFTVFARFHLPSLVGAYLFIRADSGYESSREKELQPLSREPPFYVF